MSTSNPTVRVETDLPDGWMFASVSAKVHTDDPITVRYGDDGLRLHLGNLFIALTAEQWRALADAVYTVMPMAVNV